MAKIYVEKLKGTMKGSFRNFMSCLNCILASEKPGTSGNP